MRGQTLIETLFSCFLLVSTALLLVTLLTSSLSGHVQAERISTATRIAEKTLSRIQTWARIPANFRTGRAAYTAFSGSDPDEPGYQITVDCPSTSPPLFSPCRSLEALYVPLGVSRQMTASSLPLKVEVSWGSGARDRVTIWSHLTEPPRPLSLAPVLSSEGTLTIPPGGPGHPLVLNRTAGPSDPVPLDQIVTFEARLMDSTGAQIPDVMFECYIVPVSGNATLIEGSRSKETQQLQHRYNFNPFTNSWEHFPGVIRLRARARYQGVEILQETPDIVLGNS